MTGLGSQTWSEEDHKAFPLPEIPGDFNFVNSQGLAYEAEEVNRCLREGLPETPAFDGRECLSVMGVLSNIRAKWGA